MYCIYIHTNKINGKKYCGMTNDLSRRWRCEGIEYKPPTKEKQTSRPFWNAIVKYGWDNFEHKVVYEELTQEEAWKKEKELIKELDLTNVKKGYNVAEGGNGGKIYKIHPRGMLGKSQTEYNNESCRERFTKYNPMHTSVKWGVTHEHPRGFLGGKHTEETKKRISEKLKGKTFSKERNEKISKKLKGRTFSEEHLENIKKAMNERVNKDGFRANCSKWIRVDYPNGKIELYSSKKRMENHLGISNMITKKYINTNKEYIPKYEKDRKRLSHIIGIKINSIEDTEITENLKKFLVS